MALRFVNRGAAGAVFRVYRLGDAAGPRYYTVEAGKTLEAVWPIGARDAGAAFEVHGPAGFYRAFDGTGRARLS